MKNFFILIISAFTIGGFLHAQQPADSWSTSGRAPGGPPNEVLEMIPSDEDYGFFLKYDNDVISSVELSANARVDSSIEQTQVVEQNAMTQTIKLHFDGDLAVSMQIHASREAIAAETRGPLQDHFPMVRTSHGPSQNLRNNAVYDRQRDWMIELPHGSRIISHALKDGGMRFDVTFTGVNPEIIFRPGFYQKHKNIEYFEPWTYSVWKGSVSGWCSWWAYLREFRQEHHEELLKVWREKKFQDYGYSFIQIDDVYQGAKDDARRHSPKRMGYTGGQPDTWLDWRPEYFPDGLHGYVDSVREAGFRPAVWVGSFFSAIEPTEQYPNWFVQDDSGKPIDMEWSSYVVDATNPDAANALIRPIYRGFSNAGVEYVKIDQLRHMLYDNLHNHLKWCQKRGVRPADVLRAYLRIAREELGSNAFILSCWGVLPESVGLADACRIGGDGYGPVTMQQYNSWNGIVWRNDPDHCDIRPKRKPAETGNVRRTEEIVAEDKDMILRPALASIAGCMLMLSDRPDVYEDESNLRGIRRSAPVVFSVPGQLYDFDPVKTDRLREMRRTDIIDGTKPSPIDGDQHGYVCPWWLNEFDIDIDHWSVLHRLNWSDENLPEEMVEMQDIGLDPKKTYLVYEYWSDKMIGIVSKEFVSAELEPKGLRSYAIRELVERPQLVSTNRHLSQGAVDLEALKWEGNSLEGRSHVVAGDEYTLVLHVPEGFRFKSANYDNHEAEVEVNGSILRVSFLPEVTQSISWRVSFIE